MIFNYIHLMIKTLTLKFLETAHYLIVTSDSVNMVSETATISTPLFVSYFQKEEGKILNFLENLNDLGVIKKFEGRII